MTRVYVVEDNPHLLEDVLICLTVEGLECLGASNYLEFAQLMATQLSDVVVLDWMLPDKNGLLIAQALREDKLTANIGIVFLTARSAIEDRIEGLEIADAYLVKPVDYRELAAVIHSVHRRLRSLTTDNFQEPFWRLSAKHLRLISPLGEMISLSQREYIVLRELIQCFPLAASAKSIIEAMGENWLTFDKNRLELMVSRLRTKLKLTQEENSNLIRSIRNQGYRLMIAIENDSED